MSRFLERIKGREAEGGAPVFKFEFPGDVIVAQFRGRRTVNVKGSDNGPARALDVFIIESESRAKPGPQGPATIFESGHITQLLDGANLNVNDVFSLRFVSQNRKSRFKAFAFEQLSDDESCELFEGQPAD